jgi:septum formation protein
VLASQSPSRTALLEGAGLEFDKLPANLDETSIRTSLEAEKTSPTKIAEALAVSKAEYISIKEPDAITIGADQVLALGNDLFEKPADLREARNTVLKLSGKIHKLHAAVCLATDGEVFWMHSETASLKMRELSPEFVDYYLEMAGEQVCTSVGAYQLEALGVHLFEQIDGNYFTILGLPLLPLLQYMQACGYLKK